jgi:hypothetical protein
VPLGIQVAVAHLDGTIEIEIAHKKKLYPLD